jgi:hypothetical protein
MFAFSHARFIYISMAGQASAAIIARIYFRRLAMLNLYLRVPSLRRVAARRDNKSFTRFTDYQEGRWMG